MLEVVCRVPLTHGSGLALSFAPGRRTKEVHLRGETKELLLESLGMASVRCTGSDAALSALQEVLGSGRLSGLESLHVTTNPWKMVSLLEAMALHPPLVHLRELTLDVEQSFFWHEEEEERRPPAGRLHAPWLRKLCVTNTTGVMVSWLTQSMREMSHLHTVHLLVTDLVAPELMGQFLSSLPSSVRELQLRGGQFTDALVSSLGCRPARRSPRPCL